MKPLSPQELSDQLSLYIDNELPEAERRELEQYLSTHPEAAEELRQLQFLKQRFQNRQKLPVNVGFWTRLSVALDTLKQEEHNLLPFPRRYLPAATVLGALSMLVVGVILFQQRQPILDFISQKTEEVHQLYEGGLLKGTIIPLLSDIGKDEVLQFALFGTLPLDEKSETALRVDETAEKGYRLEVGKPVEKKIPSLTVKEFYDEIQPTPVQEKMIDSLLRFTKQQLEASVLVAENQAMAISPDLPQLGRVTVSSIAACLEPQQRVRFERFLQLRNAPYTVDPAKVRAEKVDKIFEKIHKPPRPEQFVILTPETLVVHKLELNIDSLREEMQRRMRGHAVEFSFDRLVQRVQRLKTDDGVVVVGTQPMRVSGNRGSFRIEFEARNEELRRAAEIEQFVKPRFPRPNVVFFGREEPFDIEVFMNDSLIPLDEKMDSMIHYMRVGRPKSYGPKLDSLMRHLEHIYADSIRAKKTRMDSRRENE